MPQTTQDRVGTDTVRLIFKTVDTTPTAQPVPREPHQLDISVSTIIPLADLAMEVAEQFVEILTSQKINADWLYHPGSALVIAPAAGADWDQSATLADLGITDGATVILTTEEANERFPELFETLADQAIASRGARFAPWTVESSHTLASVGFPVLVTALSVVSAAAAISHGGMIQWILAGVLGVLGLVFGIAAVTLAQYKASSASTPAYSLATHALLGSAAAAVVPTDHGWTVWNIGAAAVVVTATAAGMLALKAPTVWTHVAVLAGAASVTIGLGVSQAYATWRDVTTAGQAGVVATVAFLVFFSNVGLARRIAKLDTPTLPDPDKSIGEDHTLDLVKMSEEISDGESWAAMIHADDRNVAARYASLGIFIGTGVVAFVSAIIAGATLGEEPLRLIFVDVDGRWVGLLTFAVLAALFILRGTWNIDAGLCTAGIVSGIAVAVGYVTGATMLGDDTAVTRIVGMIAVALAATVLGGRALFSADGEPDTERKVKWLQTLEMILLVLVLTDAATMLNVADALRSR